MAAQYLTIEAKNRQHIGFLASLADFSSSPGDEVNPDVVLADPNLSLYCLDDATQRAIFVELPDGTNLAAAPFVYMTQYTQAQRLVAVPYDSFRQLAQTLPTVQHLIVVYISGRSGSTLLSHVFNALDGTRSLAEPDVATQFVHLRSAAGQRDAELHGLLDATVRFLFKPAGLAMPTIYAVKLRNEGLRVMDLYQATFPHAKNLFLYRDAVGFVRSFTRLMRTVGGMPEYFPIDDYQQMFSVLINPDFTRMVDYLDPGVKQVSIPQHVTLWWLAIMEWYLAQYDRGMPILGIHYDDLNAHPEEVLTAIFTHCGLPPARVSETLGVFERDSQAGTPLARENPAVGNQMRLSDAELAEIARIVQRHSRIKDPNFIAPGTYRVEG